MPASSRIVTDYNVNNGIVTLRLNDIHVYDAGVFKIVAENYAGRSETAGILTINKAPVIDGRTLMEPEPIRPSPMSPKQMPMIPPSFIVGLPANFKLHEGESITLTCQVDGMPKPTVS